MRFETKEKYLQLEFILYIYLPQVFMKSSAIFILVFLFCTYNNAQSFSPQVVASSGNYYSNANGSLSVTIGEMTSVNTVSNSSINLILTQGFQQNENPIIYPLTLISFTASRNDKTVLLNWIVENEIAISSYTVEHSANGKDFTAIGNVKAKNNGQLENKYPFTDYKAGTNTVFYRLSIIEMNGEHWNSWIVKLNGNGNEIKVYPVPVKHNFYVEISMMKDENKELKLYNMAGNLLWVKNYLLKQGKQRIAIDMSNLPAGSYSLSGLDQKNIMVIKE